MPFNYYFSIEDYHGDSYEESQKMSLDYEYDLNDQFSLSLVAEYAAEEYWSDGGYMDSISWAENSVPLKVFIWKSSKEKVAFNVWCEMVPSFTAIIAND